MKFIPATLILTKDEINTLKQAERLLGDIALKICNQNNFENVYEYAQMACENIGNFFCARAEKEDE